MTPMPVNPKVVVQMTPNGTIASVASNLGNDLAVEIAADADTFNLKAAGMPYNSTVPVQPQQPLNSKFRQGKA